MIQNHSNVFCTLLFQKAFQFYDEPICVDFTNELKKIHSVGKVNSQITDAIEQFKILRGFVIEKLERIINGYKKQIDLDDGITYDRKEPLKNKIKCSRSTIYHYPIDSWASWIDFAEWNEEKTEEIRTQCGAVMNFFNRQAGIELNKVKRYLLEQPFEEKARPTLYIEYTWQGIPTYAEPVTKSNIFERVEDIKALIRNRIECEKATFYQQTIIDSDSIDDVLADDMDKLEEDFKEVTTFCKKKLPTWYRSLDNVLESVTVEANKAGGRAHNNLLALIFRIS